ncbi:MAG: pre-peptidase C-terminal domain-containing protein, partial [Candidatus Methanomethylicaceae archaeon]
SVLLPYVEGGGSLVTTGWGIYASGGLSEWGLGDEFDAVVPVNTIDGYNYFYGEWIDPVGWHPIIEGVNSFYVDTYIEFSGGYPQVDDNATVLATVFEEEMGEVPVAAVAEIGDGRSVYLGPIYAGSHGYYTEGLRSGDPDRFLEQAIAWAAREGGTDSADIYLIHVNEGDNLAINTSTPGDGEGEPLNDLDPMFELYDPDGNLVSSDDNSASDGRNAEISYNAESSGAYLVRISSVSGGGEYILQIEGATGAILRPFWVTGSSITDGALLNTIPEHLTLNFSEPVLLTTLEAGDLKVNGDPAAGFTVIDSNTIRFDIGSLITDEGDYHVTIDEALVKDIHGTSNQGWGLSFYFDITYPEVIDTNISDGEVIPSGALTITATFSEEMASAVGIEDVWLIENFSGKKINASSLSFNEVNQITAELPLLGDGFYTLTLASGPQAFRDLAGNYLNEGDSFTLNFSVDSDVNPFPVPLNEKLPTGSLIFDPPIESAFHETGDVDAYTLELDSGQVLSVRLNPVDGSFQGRLRVFDPFDNLLGEVTSGGAGMIVYLQTLPVTEAGTYRIEAESVTGAGRYRLVVLLNAAFERNRFLGDGDTLGLAQDIDLSFIDLGDVSRGAVRGNLSASNYASRPVSGLANIFSAGLDSAFDGILPPFVRFSTGSGKIITFPSITGLVSAGGNLMNGADGGDFFSGTTDILSYQGISGIIYGKGDPDFPDYETYPELGYIPGKTMFLVGVFLGPDEPTEPAPERLDFTDSPYGIGTDFIDLYPEIGQTFFIGDGLTSEGELQQFHVPEGATRLFLGFADAEQFGYPSSEPGYYGDNAGNLNVNISLNTIQSPDRDWYSFTLNEGQVTTITLTHDSHDQAPNVSLRLFNEAGNLMTVGMRDAFNVDRYIAEFLPTSTGTYYVRVGGTTPGNYSLVITRGSGFDLEPNDMNSQSLNLASAILGGLGGLGRGISEDEPTGEVELGINLYDGTGYLWDISDQGSIGDGTSDA